MQLWCGTHDTAASARSGEAFAQPHPRLKSWHRHGGLPPRSETFERVEQDRDRFNVRFARPSPGEVLRLDGLRQESTGH